MLQIGNAWIDDNTSIQGIYDYYWTHALNSDETNAGINKYCDYVTGNFSDKCLQYQSDGDDEIGGIDVYNIYAPICLDSSSKHNSVSSMLSETKSATHKSLGPCYKRLNIFKDLLLLG